MKKFTIASLIMLVTIGVFFQNCARNSATSSGTEASTVQVGSPLSGPNSLPDQSPPSSLSCVQTTTNGGCAALTPLYVWFNNSTLDYYYTVDKSGLAVSNLKSAGYSYLGIMFYVFASTANGLQPIERLAQGGFTTYSFGSEIWTNAVSYTAEANSNKWNYQSTEGYLAPTAVAGTVPIYMFQTEPLYGSPTSGFPAPTRTFLVATTNAGAMAAYLTSFGYSSKNYYLVGYGVGGYQPSTCPSGYVLVPGNSAFQTTSFCVMKYEAQHSSSYNALSTAAKTYLAAWNDSPVSTNDGRAPWVVQNEPYNTGTVAFHPNFLDAFHACANAGGALPSLGRLATINSLLVNDPVNWQPATSGVANLDSNGMPKAGQVGHECLYLGNTDPFHALNPSTGQASVTGYVWPVKANAQDNTLDAYYGTGASPYDNSAGPVCGVLNSAGVYDIPTFGGYSYTANFYSVNGASGMVTPVWCNSDHSPCTTPQNLINGNGMAARRTLHLYNDWIWDYTGNAWEYSADSTNYAGAANLWPWGTTNYIYNGAHQIQNGLYPNGDTINYVDWYDTNAYYHHASPNNWDAQLNHYGPPNQWGISQHAGAFWESEENGDDEGGLVNMTDPVRQMLNGVTSIVGADGVTYQFGGHTIIYGGSGYTGQYSGPYLFQGGHNAYEAVNQFFGFRCVTDLNP